MYVVTSSGSEWQVPREQIKEKEGSKAVVVPIGAMVEVYWPDDNLWYKAYVTGHKEMQHELTYTDDGVVETLDLEKEQYNVLNNSINEAALGARRSGRPRVKTEKLVDAEESVLLEDAVAMRGRKRPCSSKDKLKMGAGGKKKQKQKRKPLGELLFEDVCKDEGLSVPKGGHFELFQGRLAECDNAVAHDDAVYADIAREVLRADYIAVFAGAGCSADCGLPVYRDIAQGNSTAGKTYRELCDPVWLSSNPEVFFEFFGSCHDLYLRVKPHPGYQQLLQLLQQKGADKTFVLTSNVDAMFRSAGFNQKQLYEFHGNIKRWQCEDGNNCAARVWEMPEAHRFRNGAEAGGAEAGGEEAGQKGGRISPRAGAAIASAKGSAQWKHLMCPSCGMFARPNIQMFNDRDYKKNKPQVAAYRKWRQMLYKQLKASASGDDAGEDPPFQLLILEIGCGTSVPRLRWESEALGLDFGDHCTVVRINKEQPGGCVLEGSQLISVRAGAQEAIQKIDTHVRAAASS
jgi:NAD-dependent SIR2 family protein deacetylase